MMDMLEPLSYGQALAGAGGGGFMYVIAKEPNAHAKIEALLRSDTDLPSDMTFHKVTIDREGLAVFTSAT